jgi:hypothetical protein
LKPTRGLSGMGKSSSAIGLIRFLINDCGSGNKNFTHYPAYMNYYKAFGLQIASEIDLPELSKGEAATHKELHIRRGQFDLPKLKKTGIKRRGITACFGADKDGDLVLHWDGVADFKTLGTETLVVQPLTEDPNLLSLFTVSEAIGLILFKRNFFLLHASAVQVGEHAWCFTGKPGAGKSTTAAAFMKAGCTMLSDDLTAITFDANGKAYVVPAYPQIKIWEKTVDGLQYDKDLLSPVSEGVKKFSFQPRDSFDHTPLPLEKIFLIHSARNQPALASLSAGEIPVQMLRNFPLPIKLLSGDAVKQHFLQSFMCASSAEIIKKRRSSGFAKLEEWVNESLLSHSDSITG